MDYASTPFFIGRHFGICVIFVENEPVFLGRRYKVEPRIYEIRVIAVMTTLLCMRIPTVNLRLRIESGIFVMISKVTKYVYWKIIGMW